jgi:hypothetical protein
VASDDDAINMFKRHQLGHYHHQSTLPSSVSEDTHQFQKTAMTIVDLTVFTWTANRKPYHVHLMDGFGSVSQ